MELTYIQMKQCNHSENRYIDFRDLSNGKTNFFLHYIKNKKIDVLMFEHKHINAVFTRI